MNPFIYSTPSGAQHFSALTPGVVLVLGMGVLACLFPREAAALSEMVCMWVRLEILNARLYIQQRRLHAQLAKSMKDAWGVEPPPFKFVRLQDRGGNDGDR